MYVHIYVCVAIEPFVIVAACVRSHMLQCEQQNPNAKYKKVKQLQVEKQLKCLFF